MGKRGLRSSRSVRVEFFFEISRDRSGVRRMVGLDKYFLGDCGRVR